MLCCSRPTFSEIIARSCDALEEKTCPPMPVLPSFLASAIKSRANRVSRLGLGVGVGVGVRGSGAAPHGEGLAHG